MQSLVVLWIGKFFFITFLTSVSVYSVNPVTPVIPRLESFCELLSVSVKYLFSEKRLPMLFQGMLSALVFVFLHF